LFKLVNSCLDTNTFFLLVFNSFLNEAEESVVSRPAKCEYPDWPDMKETFSQTIEPKSQKEPSTEKETEMVVDDDEPISVLFSRLSDSCFLT